MAFTAQDVKKLREMTNVGMMDCKKALQACDGDMDKAVDWLREKGLAKAAKKADRIAAEGVAYATVIDGVGVVIEVNSETDFAAKTDAFMDLVKNLATAVATENPADVEALKACKYPNSNLTVTEIMQEKVMSIGENMQIRRFARFAEGTSVAYVHAGGTHGVLVNFTVEGDADVTEMGKNVAMQIAAMSPKYWDKAQVPQADVDKEMAVQVALMDNDPRWLPSPPRSRKRLPPASWPLSTRRPACCSRSSSAPTCSRATLPATLPTPPRRWASRSPSTTPSTTSRVKALRRRLTISPLKSPPRSPVLTSNS